MKSCKFYLPLPSFTLPLHPHQTYTPFPQNRYNTIILLITKHAVWYCHSHDVIKNPPVCLYFINVTSHFCHSCCKFFVSCLFHASNHYIQNNLFFFHVKNSSMSIISTLFIVVFVAFFQSTKNFPCVQRPKIKTTVIMSPVIVSCSKISSLHCFSF